MVKNREDDNDAMARQCDNDVIMARLSDCAIAITRWCDTDDAIVCAIGRRNHFMSSGRE